MFWQYLLIVVLTNIISFFIPLIFFKRLPPKPDPEVDRLRALLKARQDEIRRFKIYKIATDHIQCTIEKAKKDFTDDIRFNS